MRGLVVLLLCVAACDRVFNFEDIKPGAPDATDAPAISPDARSGYAAAVLADTPLGYWRLGTSSTTTATDESGHGNVGMFRGGVAPGADGAILSDPDTATVFDGVDDCVTMGNRLSFEGTVSFSIEAWVRPTMHAGYLGIVSKSDEDAGGNMRKGYHMYSQVSAVGFERNDGVALQDVRTGKLPLDQWSYVVVTFDGLTLTLYIDAALQATSENPLMLPPTSNAFTIGARNGCMHSFFIGAIDEVAVYGQELSFAQIENHRRVALGL